MHSVSRTFLGDAVGEDATVLGARAGGFIGHHLIRYLVDKAYFGRGVDVKFPALEPSPAVEFRILDLCRWESSLEATRDMDHVHHLAANMGGIGSIEANKAAIVHDNILIDTQMLEAARIVWELQVSLENGLAHTYAWITGQIHQRNQQPAPEAAERV